jgi:DNA-binding CsgD family transcriptional regulator
VGEDDPRALERQADRCTERGDYAGATALRERAFAGWRARGELRRSAYLAAYLIAFDHYALFGNRSVAQGWLERGTHLADQAGACAEAGWVALSRALFSSDPSTRARLVDEAARLARRFGDTNLEFDTLAYSGLALVEGGAVTEGMRRLDEAAAAVRGGEVSGAAVAGEIYCKLLVACESTLDVRRAEEWQAVATSQDGDRPGLAWVSAICRTHYGGILVAAGRWAEAEHELEEALRLYDASYRTLRSAALARLADLRVRQGRLGAARELLDGLSDDYALRPRARLEWLCARDAAERRAVTAGLERALGARDCGPMDVPALASLVDMQVACDDVPAAGRTARTLAELTAADPIDALVGYSRQAGACTAAASGAEGLRAAVGELHGAIAAFGAARLPLEAAGARLRLAELLRTEDQALARAEARGAAESFAWLGATADLDRATSLLRDLGGPARTGVRRVGALTDREAEVLSLVAQGLSNPQIADRLYISRKTASHHVSNVLTKLGVRNRAEAAAWAAAHGRTADR